LINILIFISLVYFILIIWLIIGFIKLPEFNLTNKKDKIKFSIIIPFRNEEHNISSLIKSLNNVAYSNNLFEILFIDDNSSDNSVNKIKECISKKIDYQILRNKRVSNSPKKDAITTAIKKSKYKWIVTTDADCEVSKNWLKILNAFILQKEVVFIASPVNYKAKNNFLEQFQKIDFLSLIGSTIGSFGNHKPIMCNGANLAYQKEAFYKVDGFNNNNHIASGDDVFLMEKMLAKDPKQVQFLKSKDATVYTKPESTWKNLLNQRIRWASKSGESKNALTKIIGGIVFGMNLILSVFIFLVLFQKIVGVDLKIFLLLFLLKIIIDGILLQKTFSFFKEKFSIKYYLGSILLHPFFMSIIPLLSIFYTYHWKGRSFKK